jgi:hypothetical protein
LKKRITITLDEDVFSEFREYCSSNAMKVSSKIEKLIEGVISLDSANRAGTQRQKKRKN